MTSNDLPRHGTKTRDVYEVFNEGEQLSSYEVANRVEWVSVEGDASAVASFLNNLADRGLLEKHPSTPANEYTRKPREE